MRESTAEVERTFDALWNNIMVRGDPKALEGTSDKASVAVESCIE